LPAAISDPSANRIGVSGDGQVIVGVIVLVEVVVAVLVAVAVTGGSVMGVDPQLAVALLSKSMASCVVNGLGLSTLLPVTVIVGSVVTSDPPVVPVAPGVLGVVCVDWLKLKETLGRLVSVTWNGSMTVTPPAFAAPVLIPPRRAFPPVTGVEMYPGARKSGP
jgi:hypothetical protein